VLSVKPYKWTYNRFQEIFYALDYAIYTQIHLFVRGVRISTYFGFGLIIPNEGLLNYPVCEIFS